MKSFPPTEKNRCRASPSPAEGRSAAADEVEAAAEQVKAAEAAVAEKVREGVLSDAQLQSLHAELVRRCAPMSTEELDSLRGRLIQTALDHARAPDARGALYDALRAVA